MAFAVVRQFRNGTSISLSPSCIIRRGASPSLENSTNGGILTNTGGRRVGDNNPSVFRRNFGSWPKTRPKRIRMVTFDVTGTIVSFRGSLEEHYLGAAEKVGVRINCGKGKFADAFGKAYKETSELYPCFGGNKMTAKEWWRECVLKSFRYAGATQMDEPTSELLFQRIYSTFGSIHAYEIFPDALPFLKWARRNGLVCGVLSNADERYGDSILPMLGVTHDELQFQCFSKDLKIEKPDPRAFMATIKTGEPFLTGNETESPLDPSQVFHIGNDYQKDFEGAVRAGMHAALLDRYEETELANEWKRRGVPVFRDLLDVVEYLGRADCVLG